MKILQLVFLLTIFIAHANAANYFLAIGGGGEPKKESTNFDSMIEGLGKKSRELTNWKREVVFNGGHRITESIIEKGFGSKGKPFSKNNYLETIDKYKRMIQNGEIKPGEKLLVFIGTHGAQQEGKEITHKISTTDATITNYEHFSDDSASLDDVKKLSDLALERGIKLGIIDISCHSGATLSLANKNTCVITAAGPSHYGYIGPDTFSDKLISQIAPGKSLEEIFLPARKEAIDMSFPMISTETGEFVQNEIYEKISPYLFYFDEKSNKLGKYLKNSLKDDSCCNGRREPEFEKLIRDIARNIQHISNSKSQKDYKLLLEALREYHDLQEKLKVDLRKIIEKGKEIVEVCATVPEYKEKKCNSFEIGDLLSQYNPHESSLPFFKKLIAQAENPKERKERKFDLALIKKAMATRDQLKKTRPDIISVDNFFKQVEAGERKSINLAARISLALREIYHDRYLSKKAASGPLRNPCSDFVF